MNYRALVNKAITESRVALDSISSADFADPPESMQQKFKTWVADAWKDQQLERRGWTFNTVSGTFHIGPRALVRATNSVTPSPGEVYRGRVSNAEFTVIASQGNTILEGTWGGGDAVAHLDFIDLTGNFKIGEHFDRISPSVSDQVFKIDGPGRYDFSNNFGDLLGSNITDIWCQSTAASTVQTNTASTDQSKVLYIPWENWNETIGSFALDTGRPQFVTKDPAGYVQFWPRPDRQYLILFHYQKTPQTLTSESDQPDGLPLELHDVIVWRAVMYYAESSEKPSVLTKARRHWLFYKKLLEERYMPQVTFGPSRYDSVL